MNWKTGIFHTRTLTVSLSLRHVLLKKTGRILQKHGNCALLGFIPTEFVQQMNAKLGGEIKTIPHTVPELAERTLVRKCHLPL